MVADRCGAPSPAVVAITRFEWEKVVRRVVMPSPTTKLVAFALATYASRDGANVRPGRKRLALELGISIRTVERQLAWLESHGLLHMTFNGALAGRRAMASTYQLVIAEDLPNRVAFVDASTDTRDGGSADEPPTPVTDVPPEPPTPVTRTTDTTAGSTDTRDAELPTPVSPHQYKTRATHQEVRPSDGPLRRAVAAAGFSPDLKPTPDVADETNAGPDGPGAPPLYAPTDPPY